ncbi:Protein of unknown function (DUF4236) [Actinobacteria bacterium IMCC26207]|nr:Protein of unknown function (DUF4236) [Actinobacteria bacterium IMCC26207]
MGQYNMRFRRSVGFGKWFRVNFGKKGMSVSAGVPGARKTLHSSGRQTTTFGLPGTGMSWTKVDHPNDTSMSNSQDSELAGPTPTKSSPREVAPPDEPSDLELILRVQEELNDE